MKTKRDGRNVLELSTLRHRLCRREEHGCPQLLATKKGKGNNSHSELSEKECNQDKNFQI